MHTCSHKPWKVACKLQTLTHINKSYVTSDPTLLITCNLWNHDNRRKLNVWEALTADESLPQFKNSESVLFRLFSKDVNLSVPSYQATQTGGCVHRCSLQDVYRDANHLLWGSYCVARELFSTSLYSTCLCETAEQNQFSAHWVAVLHRRRPTQPKSSNSIFCQNWLQTRHWLYNISFVLWHYLLLFLFK